MPLAALAIAAWLEVLRKQWRHRGLPEWPWATADLRAAPLAFALGSLIGLFIGNSRTTALRQVLSETDLPSTYLRALPAHRYPQGRLAHRVQQGAAIALLLALIAAALFRVPLSFFASIASYIIGIYFFGTLLPLLRVWKDAGRTPCLPAPELPSSLEQAGVPPGRRLKLRGVFNPLFQIVWAAVLIGAFCALATWLAGDKPFRKDVMLSPTTFAVGLLAGYPLGVKRLRVLRRIALQVNGIFFLSQIDPMLADPEGALVSKVQGLITGGSVLLWLGIPLAVHTWDLFASLAAFPLGAYLTGKTLPFIRLALELRAERSRHM